MTFQAFSLSTDYGEFSIAQDGDSFIATSKAYGTVRLTVTASEMEMYERACSEAPDDMPTDERIKLGRIGREIETRILDEIGCAAKTKPCPMRTAAFRAVFGDDVVEAVFVEEPNGFDERGDGFAWDGEALVVLLRNGRRVHMGNSEWAHIRALD
jgi:hypothetical protein